MIKFDWDSNKAKSNLTKHNVSFEEASTIFSTDQIRVFVDDANSTLTEERLIAIGYSSHDRILTVVHCYKENDEVIRIISARKATKQEKNYFEGE
jgi:hypothetical protein